MQLSMFEYGMPADGKSAILVLEAALHDRNDDVPAALRELGKNTLITELAVNPATAKPTDWDSALQAILHHDQCITL